MSQTSNPSEVSKRYAKALFEVVSDANSEKTLAQLRKIQETLSIPKIKNLVESPVLSRKDKVLIVDQVASQISLDKDLLNLIQLLATKDRLAAFDDIVKSFESISDERNQVLRGVVQSSQKLSPEDKKAIEKQIADFTKAQLILEYVENPSLIGGIQATVGSYTFDGSIDTQLRKLKEEVKARV